MKQTPALDESLKAARAFSLQHGINYISSQPICYSIVEQTDVSFFMNDEDKAIFLRKLFEELMREPKVAKRPGAQVPITEEAEIIIRLALQYMEAFEEDAVDTTHFLLAMLSCDTASTTLLKERGVVFRNFLDRLTERIGVSVDFPDQLYPQTDYLPRKRKLGIVEGLFNPKAKEALGLRYLQDSLQLLEFREPERSMQALALATQYALQDEQFFLIKINILLRAKNWQGALDTIKNARANGIPPDHVFIAEALCLSELGMNDDCLELCKSRLDVTAHVADACNLIGFTLSELNDDRQAIEYYDRALQLQPDYAFALNNKGLSLFRTREKDAGIALINASLQIDKGNSYAYRNLAIIAKESGDLVAARAMADKAFLFGYKQDFGDDLDELLNS